jgi:hypothetical protein
MAIGGIPARTTVCATVQASALGDGKKDATAAIQEAIDGCPEGQVVQLSAGTFTINSGLLMVNKGITLRGAGPASTTLQRTNGATKGTYKPGVAMPVIVVGSARWDVPGGASLALAADGAKGAISVRLKSGGRLHKGDVVLLDELSGAAWQPDPEGRGQIWASPDFRVVYQRHDPKQPTDDPWPAAAGWFSRPDRPTAEIKEVEAWDEGTRTLTFTTPLHIDYRVSHVAQIHVWPSEQPVVRLAGLEGFKVQGGDDGQIRFERAAYSWASRIENTGWLGEGFAVDASFRVEIRDSYVHTPVWFEPGGGSYNISLSRASSEILLENDISVDADKVMVARAAGAGSVVGYNYMDDGHIDSNPKWVEIGLNASHMVGPHHVLFEGNYAFNADSDHTHGNSILHTFFRNYLSGARRSFGGGPARCVGLQAYSYDMAFVGNVLGTPGKMEGWVYESGSMSAHAVWMLGWDSWAPYPVDARIKEHTYRHGNFDYLTGQVAWDPHTPGRELPPSLYLDRAPAFFQGRSWPWVNPTGGTRVGILPAKARFDAGKPFDIP